MADIKKLDLNDPDTKSADIVAGNVEALKALFPEAFKEGGIDFEVLKQLLGGAVDDRDEKYGLNWHGKRKARQIALTPSTGTLLPCPNESVDWDKTQNLMIEGDNLEVLKLMQKSYAGKVKLIYIDPPYNTGGDFVYPDEFRDSLKNYLELTGQVEVGRKITSNSESGGRFHTEWLSMMYPRIKLARNLMREDGVILVSIDDHEVMDLKALCSEIFGEENFIITIVWEKGRKNDSTFFSETVEYMHVFAKNKEALAKLGVWREKKPGLEGIIAKYDELRKQHGTDHGAVEEGMRRYYDGLDAADPTKKLKHFWRSDDRGLFFGADISSASTSIPDYEIIHPVTKKPCKKPSRGWGCNPDEMDRRIAEDRVLFGEDETTIPLKKSYLVETDSIVKTPVLYKDGRAASLTLKSILGNGIFDNPKDHLVLADLLGYAASSEALILDFFAGSGSTAHAVWHLNTVDQGSRRHISVQLPEPLDPDNKNQKAAVAFCDKLKRPRNIAELTKERLRRTSAAIRSESPLFKGDLGFRVFKLAPSNILAWEPSPADLEASLLKNAEHLVHGRTEADVLYELLLKLGLDLCVPIEQKDIAGKTVHAIGGGALMACLADGLTKEVVEPLSAGIVAWQKELSPAVDTRVVFKDSGFADDIAKTNMAAILNQNGISDVRSL